MAVRPKKPGPGAPPRALVTSLSRDTIIRMMKQVNRATAALPRPDLLPGERMAYGSRLFNEDMLLVRTAIRVLTYNGALFPDLPFSARDLEALQDRAYASWCMRTTQRDLLKQTDDCYLKDQAAALEWVMVLVRQVRAEAQLPVPTVGREQRQAAIFPLERLLGDRTQRKQDKAQRNAKARARAAAAPETPPARLRPSPQRRAMKDVADLERRTQLLGVALGAGSDSQAAGPGPGRPRRRQAPGATREPPGPGPGRPRRCRERLVSRPVA